MADKDIHILYYNQFGIGFLWNTISADNKIQLVFRDMSLELAKPDLILFQKFITASQSNFLKCKNCKNPESCRSIPLETPIPQLKMAVSTKELENLKDLIDGILFHWDLNRMIGDVLE